MDFLFTWNTVSLGWTFGFIALEIVVNIIFASAVYQDAKRQQFLIFIGPGLWCVATVVGGVITAALYWAMHHSRLNPSIPGTSTESDETEI